MSDLIELNVFCDESGLLHSNSNKRYFVIGGFYGFPNETKLIKTKYSRALKKIKIKREMSKAEELKTHIMTDDEKIFLFNAIQNLDEFHGFALVLDKNLLHKKVEKESIFFNYLIMILVDRIIIPSIREYKKDIAVVINLFPDNRNTSVASLKSLEDYLNTLYYFDRYNFKVQYCDSANNYNIQIADLIANTFYVREKDKEIVKKVLGSISVKKIIVTHFPGSLNEGGIYKYQE